MSESLITYELEDSVALIGLARPEKRNAFNDELRSQLEEAISRAGEEARAGVLFGHGDHFSAGLDLAEAAAQMGTDGWRLRHMLKWQTPSFDQVARGPIPFVAALRGAVIGGGFEIAAACHIRVGDSTTFFALPEARRGIYVGGGGSVRIARLIGYARMSDLMLTGRAYAADEAERMGLLQYLDDDPLAKARALATTISQNASESNFAITNGLPRIQDMSYRDGLFWEQLLVLAAGNESTEARLADFLGGNSKVRVKPSRETDGTT